MEFTWIFSLFLSSKTLMYVLSFITLGCGAYFMFQQAATVGGATPLDLQSLEELRLTMATILQLSITNLGESLPRGRTWEELAQEIHKGSESRELLIFLITELMKVQVENKVTQHALLIIMKWKFPNRPDPVCPWTFPE